MDYAKRAKELHEMGLQFNVGLDAYVGYGLIKDFNVPMLDIKCHDDDKWDNMIAKMSDEKRARETMAAEMFWDSIGTPQKKQQPVRKPVKILVSIRGGTVHEIKCSVTGAQAVVVDWAYMKSDTLKNKVAHAAFFYDKISYLGQHFSEGIDEFMLEELEMKYYLELVEALEKQVRVKKDQQGNVISVIRNNLKGPEMPVLLQELLDDCEKGPKQLMQTIGRKAVFLLQSIIKLRKK